VLKGADKMTFCSSPEVIMLFVYMKCRFSLSYRELEEIANMRGLKVDHATIQRWVVRFARLIDLEVRKNKRLINENWRMDETYIKVKGKWAYLYRALDSSGNTIDFLLRKLEIQLQLWHSSVWL
jgi:putative transposase